MDTLIKQARRDLNPQPPDLESGALAVRATGPYHDHSTAALIIDSTRGCTLSELPGLPMYRMLSTKTTVFLALEAIGSSAFVLHGGVVTLSTAIAC